MPSGITYKPIKTWSAAQTATDELAGLEPHQKLILLSDGSLTLELEILTDCKIRAEVIRTGTSEIAAPDAGYLDVELNCKALKRTVWLIASGKRLVYAHTVIPLKNVDAGILEAIEKTPEEPLGRIFLEKGVFFTKDKLEIAAIRCAEAAEGLGVKKDAPLFARRCILTNKANGGKSMKAAVIEVFSPDIVPCGPSRTGP
ncbi:MAG: chorismate lyase [Deltaproteobacteria bacterium]|nr:chorismate lyase [Deltaproteobacteria bacterium]